MLRTPMSIEIINIKIKQLAQTIHDDYLIKKDHAPLITKNMFAIQV
jgi:hypothetical protein